MTQWIIFATILQAEASTVHTLAQFEGDEEKALLELRRVLNSYDCGATKVKRREIFEVADRSYFLRVSGRISKYEGLVQLGRLVADTQNTNLPDSL